MRITIEAPDTATIVTVNALYRFGNDLRLTSACVTDPGDGEAIVLDVEESGVGMQ